MIDTKNSDPFDLKHLRHAELLKTRSRLRVWWLCKFGGFRVISVSQLPQTTMIGGVRYLRTWWLAQHTNGR